MFQDESVPQVGRPEHLDPAWRFMPLNEDRKPVKSEADDPRFWEGAEADWDAFQEWVATGGTIGILPERSGLVIIDCDAKREFVVQENTARFQVRHGIDDLKRVAAEHGESVEATFTVRTKSGGYHLYYLQNPQLVVTSKGHRESWRVDVKASRNAYAVAAPSVGYEVVRDVKAAVLPLWLASWVSTLNASVPPVGGAQMKHRVEQTLIMKADMMDGTSISDTSLYGQWCQALLSVVSASNAFGNWNNTIYQTAHEFFQTGRSLDEVIRLILPAADPRNETEERNARRTIESAWRNYSTGGWSGYESE